MKRHLFFFFLFIIGLLLFTKGTVKADEYSSCASHLSVTKFTIDNQNVIGSNATKFALDQNLTMQIDVTSDNKDSNCTHLITTSAANLRRFYLVLHPESSDTPVYTDEKIPLPILLSRASSGQNTGTSGFVSTALQQKTVKNAGQYALSLYFCKDQVNVGDLKNNSSSCAVLQIKNSSTNIPIELTSKPNKPESDCKTFADNPKCGDKVCSKDACPDSCPGKYDTTTAGQQIFLCGGANVCKDIKASSLTECSADDSNTSQASACSGGGYSCTPTQSFCKKNNNVYCQLTSAIPSPPACAPQPCAHYNTTTKQCDSFITALGPISTDPQSFYQSLATWMFSLLGGIALIIIIIAGYRIMTSQGDPEKMKGGKEMLTAAITGLLFTIFSLAIYQTITGDILHLPCFGGGKECKASNIPHKNTGPIPSPYPTCGPLKVSDDILNQRKASQSCPAPHHYCADGCINGSAGKKDKNCQAAYNFDLCCST